VYKKAGVILDGLETAGQQQLNLFATTNHGEVRAKLLADIDALNRRYGAGTVGFAAALAAQGSLRAPWLGKAEFRSAAYTTNWNELWAIR
jgi:DNA polymerase V